MIPRAGVVDIVAATNHACLLLDTGRVMCWGNNDAGQLGIGFDDNEICTYRESGPDGPVTYAAMCVRRPREVPGLDNVVKVAVNTQRSCALRRDGTVWCWGQNDQLPDGTGSLGDNRPADEQCVPYLPSDGGRMLFPESAVVCRSRPVQVVGLTDAVDLAVGAGYSCAVRATGRVVCWGFNENGELGDGSRRTPHAVPTPVRWY